MPVSWPLPDFSWPHAWYQEWTISCFSAGLLLLQLYSNSVPNGLIPSLWVALLLENLNYFPMWKTGLLVPLVATAWWIFNDLFRDGNGKVAWCTRFALGAFGAVGLHWLITGSLV